MALGFPHRPQNINIVNAGLGYARSAQESAHPGLWRNHVGTVAPCLHGGFGADVIEAAHRGDRWVIQPTLGRVMSPIGPAFDFDAPANASDFLKHSSGASDASMYKFDAPFTLSMFVNCHTYSGTDLAVFFVSDRKGGSQKYAGIHVFRSDDESMTIAIGANTSTTMFSAGGMTTFQTGGSFITQSKWSHLVVVCRTFALPDIDKTVGMDFWQNGQMENYDDVTKNANTQGMAHASSGRASNIGWLRGDKPADPEGEAYSLALWQCWTRALSTPEVHTLNADPLAMFRIRRRTLGLVPSRIVSLGGYYKTTGSRVVLVG